MGDSAVWIEVMDGAEMAILSGDPDAASSSYVIRFRTSREIRVPAHWHPEDEHVTILQGPYAMGFGDRFDEAALEGFPAGAYVRVPRNTRHFTRYGAGTLVQTHGVGRFEMIYVNPEDDPARS